MERYRLQEWLTFVSSELHKGIGVLFNPKLADDAKQVFKEKAATRLAWLDKELAGKDFLTGSHFTAADAYAFTVLRWTVPLGIDLSAFANIRAYMDRVAARPKVQEALRAEGLLKTEAA